MYNLISFFKRYFHILLFILAGSLSVYLIQQNSYYQSSIISSVTNSVSGRIGLGANNIVQYFNLTSQNNLLLEENTILRRQLENSYIKYNSTVFRVEDTIYKQKFDYVGAKIIKKTINKRNNYFMLDKGTMHGVSPDMGVICADGIVGIVVKATNSFSLVMSVLHQDSKPNIRNSRTQISGTMLWNGDDYRYASLADIPASIPVKRGDTLTTSGFSQKFPEGINIGRITSFQKDDGTGFYTVRLKFFTDYNKLDYVYVVKNLFKKEQDELLKDIK